MKYAISIPCLVFLLAATALAAQPADGPAAPPPHQPAPGHPQPSHDQIADSFLPPEFLMQNQEEIGLTDEQKQSLHAEMEKTHGRMGELHEQLQKENESLAALLKGDRIDETKALAQ